MMQFPAGTNPEERTEITNNTQLLLSKIKLFGLMTNISIQLLAYPYTLPDIELR
jgi:hypothetical protein